MSTWPSALPNTPLLQGYRSIPQNSVLTSQMTGFNKQRNRYTAVIHDVTENYWLTPSQFNIFKTFYFGTLGNGATQFTKLDPETKTNRTYRFKQPGGYNMSFNGLDYFITLSLEKLP